MDVDPASPVLITFPITDTLFYLLALHIDPSEVESGSKNPDLFKTSTWKEYVFGWMSHPTYVISVSLQAK